MFYYIRFLDLLCKVLNKLPFTGFFMHKLYAIKDSCVEYKLLPIVRSAIKNVSYIEVEASKNVWVLWLQGEKEMPELIKLCIDSIQLWMKDWNVTIVSVENLYLLTELPQVIINKYKHGMITRTHMSDIIRANLLYRHGGLWLDATVLLTGIFPLFNLNSYWTIKGEPEMKVSCVSKGRWNGAIMYCPKRHFFVHFMSLCYSLYWEKYNKLIDYFLIDYFTDMALKEIPSYRQEFEALTIYPYNINKLNKLLDAPTLDIDVNNILDKNTIHKLQRRCKHRQSNPDGSKSVYGWLYDNIEDKVGCNNDI